MAGILKVDQVQSDSNLSFQVAGANVAYMNSTGLQMTGGQITAGGNTLLNASGLIYANAGIAFPASQRSSAGANTLDDYEEGTFTPFIYGSSSSGTGTYNFNNGNYTKIGNVVTFTMYLNVTSHTGTGNLFIGGLPFAAKSLPTNLTPLAHYAYAISFSSGNYLMFYISQSGSASIFPEQLPTGGGDDEDDDDERGHDDEDDEGDDD